MRSVVIINEIHIWGEKLLYSHFSPYLPRGGNGWKIYYIAIFPLFAKGGKWLENLLYSHFSTYPGKGEVAVFPGGRRKNGSGVKWLYNTGPISRAFLRQCSYATVKYCNITYQTNVICNKKNVYAVRVNSAG
jgi:hypothetical protein